MDKWKPTYDLGAFKTAFDHVDKINVTTVAVKSAIALGFTRQGIVDVIQTIQRGHFYKSMTSHRDHKVKFGKTFIMCRRRLACCMSSSQPIW